MSSDQKIEDAQYWIDRGKDDNRMDWRNGAQTWTEEYVKSSSHPHRQIILDALEFLKPFDSILEVGCNAGPNLMRINAAFPLTKLYGIDLNKHAIKEAKKWLPKEKLMVGSALRIPLEDSSIDIVLADAALMYVSPDEIQIAMKEIARVAKKAIILVEWDAETLLGELKDFHWARDYASLMKERGFEVTHKSKLKHDEWPSVNWEKNGYLYVGVKI